MKYGYRTASLLALAVLAAPATGNAYPAGAQGVPGTHAQAPILKAGCYDDCWHSRYRSPYRWGSSYGEGNWRPRRYGWGEEGYYGHSRYWSHYRWGSYHRYWRPCRSCDWDD
ncbi:MAG: hypothetical protein ACLPPF_19730 [Rhodomicrobium sp.]